VRLVLEDRVELPRLYMAWHSPALFAEGDAELDLVGDLIANGKTSRLYRSLVYDRRVAVDVAAVQNSRELVSFFQLITTAARGHTLGELEQAVTEEIGRLVEGGPTEDEVARSLAQAEAHFVYRLQTVGGFGGKSDQLNAYNVFLDDPGYMARDLARYRKATPSTLQRAAAAFLTLEGRTALSVVPAGRLDLALDGSRAVVMS
jgi:zinc protease